GSQPRFSPPAVHRRPQPWTCNLAPRRTFFSSCAFASFSTSPLRLSFNCAFHPPQASSHVCCSRSRLRARGPAWRGLDPRRHGVPCFCTCFLCHREWRLVRAASGLSCAIGRSCRASGACNPAKH
ncbi:hypothetical protein TPAR_03423, partial [Tolypocladium paradoxum]